jgi:cytosine permease
MPLPDYLQKAVPNSSTNRSPWYSNTAPSYAGVFLWVVFYQALAQGTIDHAGPLFCVGALAVAGLLSYLLCYYVPAILGMTTGYPLYVVGSSTFGATGGRWAGSQSAASSPRLSSSPGSAWMRGP